ncbi:UNVERIFIED_CONTAM: hypothetical protein FKN15_075074 [Acipenser sinensis]
MYTETVANGYLECGDQLFLVDRLVNITYIFQKLAAVAEQREWIVASGAHKTLVKLLAARDNSVLLGALLALTSLAESPENKMKIGELAIVENLLMMLQEYDLLSKRDREFVSDRSSIGILSSANASGRIQQQHISEDLSPQEIRENILSLQAACCAALTELVLNDTNAHQVVQCYAFRALRFLFSMERNRHLFKRLFSAEMFEMFIDIGHYVRDITAYENLVAIFNTFSDEELNQIKESIETVNQNKAPSKIINGYAILDHLGSGAFGSVHKVRKHGGQNLLALKEVNLHNPVFGKDKNDRDSSVEKIVSELTIIKEQIVEAVYEPVPEGVYSKKVTDIKVSRIKTLTTAPKNKKEKQHLKLDLVNCCRCLTPDAELRPDIVEVSARISDVMMKYVDGLCMSQLALEKKLDRERRRTQKYFLEANRSALSCPVLSQEPYDKSSSLSSSSGAASIKSESSEMTETPSYSFQTSPAKERNDKPNYFPEDNCASESTERGSDEELDTSDTSNSSTSSPSKDLALTHRYHPCADSGGRRRTHTVLRSVSTAFFHTADSPCSHPRALGQLTGKPAGARPDYRSRWCALLQGSPELIESIFISTDCRFLCHSLGGNSIVPEDKAGKKTFALQRP